VLASAVVRAARDRDLELYEPSDVTEVAGTGVGGVVDGRKVWVGATPELVPIGESSWVAARGGGLAGKAATR